MRFWHYGILLFVFFLTGCSCTMGWDGVCHKRGSTYDPYHEQYEAYERVREKKIVPGLGRAMYSDRY